MHVDEAKKKLNKKKAKKEKKQSVIVPDFSTVICQWPTSILTSTLSRRFNQTTKTSKSTTVFQGFPSRISCRNTNSEKINFFRYFHQFSSLLASTNTSMGQWPVFYFVFSRNDYRKSWRWSTLRGEGRVGDRLKTSNTVSFSPAPLIWSRRYRLDSGRSHFIF